MVVQYSPEPVDPEQQDQGVVPWEEFLKIGKVRVLYLECWGGGGGGLGGDRGEIQHLSFVCSCASKKGGCF